MTAIALAESLGDQRALRDLVIDTPRSALSAESKICGEEAEQLPLATSPSLGKRSCLKAPSPRSAAGAPLLQPSLARDGDSQKLRFKRLLDSLASEHEQKVVQLEELQKANEVLVKRLNAASAGSSIVPVLPPPADLEAAKPPSDLPGQLIDDIEGAFTQSSPPCVGPPSAPLITPRTASKERESHQGSVVSDATAMTPANSIVKDANSKPRRSNGRVVIMNRDEKLSDASGLSPTSPGSARGRGFGGEPSHYTTDSDSSVARFKLRGMYREYVDRSSIRQDGFAHTGTAHFHEEEEKIEKSVNHCLSWAVSKPSSRRRLAWDFLGAALTVYDIISIPLLVFESSSDGWMAVFMQWATLLYWTLNIFASLLVGYEYRGAIILDPNRIVLHYLKGWFIVDSIILIPDWTFTLICLDGSCSRASESVKLFRGLRIARCLRLVRLLKMKWLFIYIEELTESEYTSIMANIGKMIIMLLVLNHVIACAWFGLADMMRKTEPSWIEHHKLIGKDWGYQYLTSFHWSITQFTPASMDVQPHNSLERAFAVTVIVFALVGFSYVVGSITGSLAQLRSLQEAMAKQFWTLKRYLRQNNVPPHLSIRIQKYVQHAWKRQSMGVTAANVKMLDMLSDQLRKELKSAIYIPHLLIHPLLSFLNKSSNIVIHRLAETAIMRKQLAGRDPLFFKGESAFCMYFIIEGRLQYSRTNVYSGELLQEYVDSHEDWISEPVMWTPDWAHVGNCTAATHCDLLQVVATDCCEVVRQNPIVKALVTVYASNYMQWLNELGSEKLNDICQGEDESDLIDSFIPKDMQEGSKESPRVNRGRSQIGFRWRRSNTMQTLHSTKSTVAAKSTETAKASMASWLTE